MKFLVMALAMVMGLIMTSCLDSDNGPQSFQGYVKVLSIMGNPYFEDLAGNKYYPTATSLADMKTSMGFDITTSNFVFIQYQLAETEGTSTRTDDGGTVTQSYSITLTYAVALDGPNAIAVDTKEDMETRAPETNPITSFGTQSAFLGTPFYYDTDYIYAPSLYKVKKAGTDEKQEDIVAQHTINLVWVAEETDADDTEMVLYLRHNREYELGEKDSELDALSYGAYRITEVMNRFYLKTGAYPKKVTIKVHETGEYNSSDDMPEEYKSYYCDAEPFDLFNY